MAKRQSNNKSTSRSKAPATQRKPQQKTKVNTTDKKQGSSLYPTRRMNPGSLRPRIYTNPVDTKDAISSYDRMEHLAVGRTIYANNSAIGTSINNKSQWCVGDSAYSPIFVGADQEWGDIATDWLINVFFPMCSVMGRSYDFATILRLTSVALDVDGESMLVLTKSRKNFPLVDLFPSHRIGQRGSEPIVKEGKYVGYEIRDGVIISDKRPIAYRFLGDKPEDDYDLAAQDCDFQQELEFLDQYRAVSKLARPSSDLQDASDIKGFLKEQTKLVSEQGYMVFKETGEADEADLACPSEDPNAPTTGTQPEISYGPGYRYMRPGTGEKIDPIKDDRPNPNALGFVGELERGGGGAVGWSADLLNPKNLSGSPTRLVQDQTRMTISSRQEKLDKRALLIVCYAIAVGMAYGFIPKNDGDWYAWNFSYGKAVTVDNGNEAKADAEGYKLGTHTLQEITAKRGYDWKQVRKQSQIEVADLLTRAKELAKEFDVPFETALTLMRQSTPNQNPTGQPPTEDTGTEPTTKN